MTVFTLKEKETKAIDEIYCNVIEKKKDKD